MNIKKEEFLFETIIDKRDVFQIVDEFPLGYTIWNIGTNMKDGYLPLVRFGGYDGCQVDITCMKSMKIKDAQIILEAIGLEQKTIQQMKNKEKK